MPEVIAFCVACAYPVECGAGVWCVECGEMVE